MKPNGGAATEVGIDDELFDSIGFANCISAVGAILSSSFSFFHRFP
jgi:hypothetical protein